MQQSVELISNAMKQNTDMSEEDQAAVTELVDGIIELAVETTREGPGRHRGRCYWPMKPRPRLVLRHRVVRWPKSRPIGQRLRRQDRGQARCTEVCV